MKNFKKFLFINIIIIFLILFFGELVSKHIEDKELIHRYTVLFPNMYSKEGLYNSLKYRKIPPFNYEKYVTNTLRKPSEGTLKNKRALTTIGCSYTYGSSLNDDETFAAQLSKFTGRTVYNRGVPGSGPQMVYRQIIDKNFTKEIPDTEYIIYVFLGSGHIQRQFLYSLCGMDYDKVTPKYKIINNKLSEEKYFYKLLFFSLGRKLLVLRNQKETRQEEKNNYPLFFKLMEESVKEINRKYKNTKFVILEFPQTQYDENYKFKPYFSKENIKRLEDMGIIYINAEELAGHDFNDVKKYRTADKDHPNASVWKEIVPKLSKKLNL